MGNQPRTGNGEEKQSIDLTFKFTGFSQLLLFPLYRWKNRGSEFKLSSGLSLRAYLLRPSWSPFRPLHDKKPEGYYGF